MMQKLNIKLPEGLKSTQQKNSQDIIDKKNLKTMLEIARELNIDKQTVYRYIKKYNMPYTYKSENGVFYFDETVQTRIKSIIMQNKSASKNSSEIGENINEIVYEVVNEALKDNNKYIETVIEKLDTIINLLQENMNYNLNK